MNKPYKIVMSRGDNIKIDSDELNDVLMAITNKTPAIVRSGIFNPSFYVSIIKDEDRHRRFLDNIKYEDNKKELIEAGCKQLTNIFKNIEVLKLKG